MPNGWKTIAGTFLLAAGQLIPAVWPDGAAYVPYLNAIGAALGGIGLRLAVAKQGAR